MIHFCSCFAIDGSQFEIPITLACYGMRRSEICALEAEDVDGDIVHINKALVQNEKDEWVIKITKTTESTRDIIISMNFVKKIKEQGYVYKGNPNSITRYLGKVEDDLGITRFSLHKLRHYFASAMSALGVPEADILRLGRWETDYVMKSVYRHSMMEKEENAKRDAAEKLRGVLFFTIHDKFMTKNHMNLCNMALKMLIKTGKKVAVNSQFY